ncbi:hypothetical protein OGM63_01305 [Plectonema radiosum NIES-515]|uniref:Uncharacterized protein n=1 Tax=Plectonema radiosum NIES-515 TaxID=2986073 RepID=A0ABT3ATX5_9CYAN|nr:hypothetical protein [Plectonema radiosum]MCV3212175.1 hypothetical protein [Plectonema radiosum NIES-515]
MQSSLKKSEFWFKAMGVASFANMTCSAIALAEMLQPNQEPFIRHLLEINYALTRILVETRNFASQ